MLDLILIEDTGDRQKMNMLMTVASDNGSSTLLQMREFPSFSLLYETEVDAAFCRPIDCGVSHETPKFVEGTRGAQDDDDGGQLSLRVRGICESVREARLQRLIRRRRFAEAEEMALAFSLPMDELHTAKATWLMERLSPWRVPEPSEHEVAELLDDLRTVLTKVTDLNFVVQCCVTAALPKLDQLR